MVVVFQLFFCAIVIGSSFFGFGTFIGTVFFSLLFTLGNVYTLPLLVVQSSVILGAGVIGFFIACVVTISKSPDLIEGYMRRIDKCLFNKGIIYSIWLFFVGFVWRSIPGWLYTIDMSILRWLLIGIGIYYIIWAPKRLAYYFQLESKRFIITIIVLIIMNYNGMLDGLKGLLFYY